ncbi:PfkB family carbohydrate kinase [Ruminococcaceae bacterium OttesenSCG-928-L11]|nr:PfkB family carbohydrate kinase [Ruminococcaceae bacterium OttesenSCG-928-L11]
MNKKWDVVALGEILIDFAPGGKSGAGMPLYECNPGGAPANVLAAVTRQGGRAAFIGKVGSDSFGAFLETTLRECDIDTSGLCVDEDTRTTLAFVSLDETGNRSFSFFRNPGADYMLSKEDVNTDLIRDAATFHFGSLSLTHEPARSATRYAVETAVQAGALISYDPNLRLALWPTADAAREQILAYLHYADIVKISDEEFEFLTGSPDYETGAAAFMEQYGLSCLFVTLGPKGAFYRCNGFGGKLPTYDVKVVDTTGSGDSFMGAVLGKLSKRSAGLNALGEAEIREIVDFANASGSMAARAKGAIPAIPTTEQVLECMRTVPLLNQ